MCSSFLVILFFGLLFSTNTNWGMCSSFFSDLSSYSTLMEQRTNNSFYSDGTENEYFFLLWWKRERILLFCWPTNWHPTCFLRQTGVSCLQTNPTQGLTWVVCVERLALQNLHILHNDTNGSLFASGVLPFFLTARLLVFGVHIQLRRMIWEKNKRIEVCAISQIRFCVKQNLF